MRRTAVAATVAFLVIALLDGAALASAAPVAGCPATTDLSAVEYVKVQVDWSISSRAERAEVETIIENLDANSDGFLCWKHLKPNQGRDKFWGADNYVVTSISDNTPSGRLGKSVIVL